jgi:nucleoside phosphorylase
MDQEKKARRMEARLQREAERRGQPVDSVRHDMLSLGLGAAERQAALDPLRADIVVVTTTSTEFDEVKRAATHPDRGLTFTKVKGEATNYFQLGTIENQRVVVIRLKSMGSFTSEGSAFTCHRVRVETSATTFIVVGTAFGINEHIQKVGDVLVSNALILYDDCDVADRPVVDGWLARLRRFTERFGGKDPPARFQYNYRDRAIVPATKFWVEKFLAARQIEQQTTVLARKTHVGNLLAGGARIESAAFREHLAARVPVTEAPIVGGEMEAAGVAAVCADELSGWIAVKGISDFATAESRAKIETSRVIAARNAAEFTLDVLRMKR